MVIALSVLCVLLVVALVWWRLWYLARRRVQHVDAMLAQLQSELSRAWAQVDEVTASASQQAAHLCEQIHRCHERLAAATLDAHDARHALITEHDRAREADQAAQREAERAELALQQREHAVRQALAEAFWQAGLNIAQYGDDYDLAKTGKLPDLLYRCSATMGQATPLRTVGQVVRFLSGT